MPFDDLKHESYIQINIYGENRKSLSDRGIDLEKILKEALIPSYCINEIPILRRKNAETARKVCMPRTSHPTPFLANVLSLTVDDESKVPNSPLQMNGFKSISGQTLKTFENFPLMNELNANVQSTGDVPSTSNVEPKIGLSLDEQLNELVANFNKNTEGSSNETFDISLVKEEPPDELFQMMFPNVTNSSKVPELSRSESSSRFPTKRRRYDNVDSNAVHVINCSYPGCGHTYSWKVKYGKLRLVDHALMHNGTKQLKCHLCGHMTQNVRQMRTHYGKEHPGEKAAGYGIRRLPMDDEELKKLWDLCYKDAIHIIGEASNNTTSEIKTELAEDVEE